MKIDRMFQILYILLEKKQVTARQLSEKFEVSTRTIYRDIDALSIAGFPIYTNKGNNGGICLLDNFVMNKALLSSEEQNNMIMGLETLRAINYEDVDTSITKLKSIFNKRSDNWIEVDFSHWGSSKAEKEKFESLKFALTNYRTISFDYYDSFGIKSNRLVNPIKLLFKHKDWYLRVYCLSKNDFRTFKASRIKNLLMTNQTFDRTLYYYMPASDDDYKSEAKTELIMKLSPNLKYRVYDEFDEENISICEDGSFLITMKIYEDEWFYNYILSFGIDVKIIKPLHINDIILEKLEKIIKNYK